MAFVDFVDYYVGDWYWYKDKVRTVFVFVFVFVLVLVLVLVLVFVLIMNGFEKKAHKRATKLTHLRSTPLGA